MNKKIVTIIISALSVTVIAGGFMFYSISDKVTINDSLADIATTTNRITRNIQPPNTEVGDKESLVLGEKITIMGATLQDGSINAQAIIVGDYEMDTRMLNASTTISRQQDTFYKNIDSTQGPPAIFNREAMQNLTQEERQQKFLEMGFEGGQRQGSGFSNESNTGVTPTVRTRQSSIVGTILDIEKGIITITLTEGGSNLVFYSDQTNIYKALGSVN